MNRRSSAVDRVVAALLGLVLLATGALMLAHRLDLGPAREWASRVAVPRVAGWPEASWWTWALVGVAVGSAALALLLVVVNVAGRRAAPRLPLPGSDETGSLTTDPETVASASAQTLSLSPGVQRHGHVARLDRGVPTLDLTVHCDPAVDLDALADCSRANARVLDHALPGSGIAQRVRVHVDRVRRPA